MKAAVYGRIVFGGSAVLVGVIALMWRDADTWQTLGQIWKLPFGLIIGECLMVLQVAGGVGMQFSRTARMAAVVLFAVYICFALACIPAIIAASDLFNRYGGSFLQQVSLVCGAMALYAMTRGSSARAATLRKAARIGLGISAISFTLSQVLYLRYTASLVPKWIPPSQMFWATLTTIAFGLAALAMLVNRQARLAAGLMALMLALFGVLVWIPRLVAHPHAHFIWSESGFTFLIAGAAWMVAELPSIART
ncbi:MAG TPA: hypothetical protein VJN89_22740 [Candidatus Acidoferrum sp.]|nr:hypothetical protein [Candidatus Acidoferrum sp.]